MKNYPKFKIKVYEPIYNGVCYYYAMVKLNWWTPWMYIGDDNLEHLFPADREYYTSDSAKKAIAKYIFHSPKRIKYKESEININIDSIQDSDVNLLDESSWFTVDAEKPYKSEILIIKTKDGTLHIGYYDCVYHDFYNKYNDDVIKDVEYFKILKRIP